MSDKQHAEDLRNKAPDAVLDAWFDQRTLVLDEKRWSEFVAALSAPPRDNSRLRRLLARKPAWDR
jgi:uncharacterized protein (DUF1778 family)